LDPRSLFEFARIKPLAAWSLSGALLGTGLAIYLSSGQLVSVLPMALAIACVVIMQYVAHPLNDIMDYDLDRQAPIGATGRFKPIVDGEISIKEAKYLSLVLVLVILVLLSYLVVLQPVLIIPAAYGMVALFGYNHPSLRWAYKPFTELYLSMPINAISVLVISFIGSGLINGVSIIVSLAFGFASSSFFVSMMSMDFPTDRSNGKRTTVVTFPRLRWCTFYPLIGLAVVLLGSPILLAAAGPAFTTVFLLISIVVFLALSWYGARVDALRLRYLEGMEKDPEGHSGYVRLRQLYLSLAYAILLSGLFVISRGV
jgi:4-hydroxybenzoate polyprenyltransferase